MFHELNEGHFSVHRSTIQSLKMERLKKGDVIMSINEAAQILEKEFNVKMIELIGENEDKYVFLSEDYRDADPSVTLYPVMDKKKAKLSDGNWMIGLITLKLEKSL